MRRGRYRIGQAGDHLGQIGCDDIPDRVIRRRRFARSAQAGRDRWAAHPAFKSTSNISTKTSDMA